MKKKNLRVENRVVSRDFWTPKTSPVSHEIEIIARAITLQPNNRKKRDSKKNGGHILPRKKNGGPSR